MLFDRAGLHGHVQLQYIRTHTRCNGRFVGSPGSGRQPSRERGKDSTINILVAEAGVKGVHTNNLLI